MPYLLVGVGGAIGACARFALSRALPPGAWPWGTLAANVLGGFAMGALIAWLAARGGGEHWRLFLGVGVLGGFTTFSAFSGEVFAMIVRGAWTQAVAYAAASVVLAVGGLALGHLLLR